MIWRLLQTAALSRAASSNGSRRSTGVDVMGKKNRSVLLVAFVPAFLLSGVFAVADAQTAGSPAAKPTNCSDPATWPNHKVPGGGAKPTTARDKGRILDGSPPALA